jgi:hypothetical protein
VPDEALLHGGCYVGGASGLDLPVPELPGPPSGGRHVRRRDPHVLPGRLGCRPGFLRNASIPCDTERNAMQWRCHVPCHKSANCVTRYSGLSVLLRDKRANRKNMSDLT